MWPMPEIAAPPDLSMFDELPPLEVPWKEGGRDHLSRGARMSAMQQP
jgi:hypothetical protein